MQTVRLVLEVFYFISGPMIALFAFLGLKQLTIAKNNAKMSAKRESYRLAADQCTHYFQNMIPLQNRLDEVISEKKVTFFDRAKVTIEHKEIKIGFNTKKDGLVGEITPIAIELLSVLNSLESFALFFVSGVADETLAFSSVGRTFCGEVRKLLPVIVLLAEGEGNFRNTIRLFLIWNERIESTKLLKNKEAIEDRLKKLDNKVIRPLGA
jgi:hypothetical protein